MSSVVVGVAIAGAAAGCTEQSGVLIARGLDFGDVPAGLDVEQVLVIENVGTARGKITGVGASEDLVGPEHRFRIGDVAREVPAGEEALISVVFTALGIQDEPITATLRLETDGEPITVRLRGRGVARGLIVEPNPLDFGGVLVGRDRVLDVTVTSALTVPVDLTSGVDARGGASIDVSAGSGRFEVISPVEPSGSLIPGGNLLQPSGSIRFQLRYTPNPVVGREDRASWTISHCPSNACAATIELRGRGRATALECEPETLGIRAAIGERATGTVRCANDSQEAIQVTSWRLSPATSELSVVPPPGSIALEPGEAVDIEVTFAPRGARGRRPEARLSVEAVDARTRREMAPAVVAIDPIAGRAIADVPALCDFGEVPVGSTGQCVVEVSNRGDEPLLFSASTDGAAFSVDGVEQVVQPGGRTSLVVRAQASAPGALEGRLLVRSNDDLRPEQAVALTAIALDGEPCRLALSHRTLDFGLVDVGARVVRAVEIANLGSRRCTLGGLRFSSADPAFALVGSSAGSALDPGASRLVELSFTPGSNGQAFASLDVLAPTLDGNSPSIALRGRGGEVPAAVAPSPIDLGPRPLGCGPFGRTVELENRTARVLRVDGVRLEAESSRSLSIERLALPIEVPPGQRLAITLTITAPPPGQLIGALLIELAGAPDVVAVPIRGRVAADPTVEDRAQVPERPHVDVLFVVYSAFDGAAQALASAFPAFRAAADERNGDWQVGVVSAELSSQCGAPRPDRPIGLSDGDCGYLAQAGLEARRVITADEDGGPDAAFAQLVALPSFAEESRGLQAAQAALLPPIATGWNAPLLRPDADLAVIFASLRDDASPGDVATSVAAIRASRGGAGRVTAWAMVPQPGETCGFVGARYSAAARALDGQARSACQPSRASSLDAFARAIFGQVDAVALSSAPDPTTIVVTIDGVVLPAAAGWNYDAVTNRVVFATTATPEPGAEIVVRYRAACS